MARKKVAIIGAGNVGATAACYMALEDICDVALVDIPQTGGMPKGKSLDMMQAGAIYGYSSKIVGGTDYDIVAGSDVVVITAGIPRKPGMDRMDLLKTNAGIVSNVTDKVLAAAPDAIIIVVSNPLDVMTYLCWKQSKKPREKVVGMAGALDCARFGTFIAMELGCSVNDVRAMVVGGHGDVTMVPVPRLSTVWGIPLPALLPQDKIDALVTRGMNGGKEIVNLLGTGSAYYAPAAGIVSMCRAMILDEKRLIPTCVRLQGEYGHADGVFVGVPTVLGANGLERIIEIKLEGKERELFDKSADSVRKGMKEIDELLAATAAK